MPLAPGTRLGPYEILSALGAGGMGEVWKARDTRLNRLVAIKTSLGPFSERFEREARAIAAVNHPHVCSLYDVGPTTSSWSTSRASGCTDRCRSLRRSHWPSRSSTRSAPRTKRASSTAIEAQQHPAHQERREGSRFWAREDQARSRCRRPHPHASRRRFSDRRKARSWARCRTCLRSKSKAVTLTRAATSSPSASSFTN